MKQLTKIKRAIMAFLGCLVAFLIIGIYIVLASPFLAFNAVKECYKNKTNSIDFDINYKNNEK